MLKI
jgi:hypothetical protein